MEAGKSGLVDTVLEDSRQEDNMDTKGKETYRGSKSMAFDSLPSRHLQDRPIKVQENRMGGGVPMVQTERRRLFSVHQRASGFCWG